MWVEDLARRLLERELERLPAGEKLQPVPLPSAGGERGFGRGPASGPRPSARRVTSRAWACAFG